MANNIFKIIVHGARVVGRAFAQAVRQEYAASQAAAQRAGGGKQGSKAAAEDLKSGMALQEARDILNVDDYKNIEEIEEKYAHLFKQNDKSKGGSFYLQSKVVRAKERLDVENNVTSTDPSSDHTQTHEPNTDKKTDT